MKINGKFLILSSSVVLTLVLLFFGFHLGLGNFLIPNTLSNSSPQEPYQISSNFKKITALLLENPRKATLELESFLDQRTYTNPIEKNYALYILGRLKQKEQEEQAAYQYYQKIDLKKIPELAARVHLHKAQTQISTGNEKEVLANCKKIINNYSDSITVPSAYYEIGRSFVRQSEWQKAQSVFIKLVKNFPKTNYGIAANYYLGVLSTKTNQEDRDQFWKKYLKESPKGHFSQEIVEIWLKEKLDRKQRELIGLSFYQQSKNQESLRFLEENWSKDSWFELGNLLLIAQKKVKARDFLANTLQRFPYDPKFTEGVSLLFRNISYPEIEKILPGLLSANPKQEAFLLWEASRFAPSKRLKFQYFYRITRELEETENNKFKVLSLRALFWQAYQEKNFPKIKDYAQKIISLDPHGESAAKTRFWLAKEFERRKEVTKAKSLYQSLLENNSRSYYAYRAQARLTNLKNKQVKDFAFWKPRLLKIFQEKKNLDCPLPNNSLLEEINPTIKRLLSLNLWQEANSLISVEQRKQNQPLDIWLTCRLENKRASSIYKAYRRIARNNLNFQTEKSTWLSAYPFAYLLAGAKASSKVNLDPILLLSIIRQESRFQEAVTSRSGATGLSQVMPATAREIARSLGLPYQREKLKDPGYNLRLGAYYLRQMLDTFERPELAIAAYNAGPGNVSKWWKNSSAQIKNDPDLFIESIPFDETRNYVVQVLENYWIYSNLFLLETKQPEH